MLTVKGNTLEKSSFREGFNQERKKRINRFSTFMSFFNSQSKECKDSEHWWNNFLLEIEVCSAQWKPRIFIYDIPSKEPSFEAMTDYLKTSSKFIKEDENMSLKNKCLIDGWILMASKVYRRENLSYRFEDWLYCMCKIKRQASYNYRNLFKLMNCRVNTTYFVKNHEIPLKYFDELEIQTPWKHKFSCTCEDCISYFGEPANI